MTSNYDVNIRFRAIDQTRAGASSAERRLAAIDRQTRAMNRTARSNATVMAASARAGRNNAAAMQAVGRQTHYAASGALLLGARYLGPTALVGGMVAATNAAGDFEEALFAIQKKSGASAEEIEKLRAEIYQLGQEVPVSLDEIAAAYERGAAAGIPLDDLYEFAKLTTQVADAWDMTAEDVANAFAGFEKGLGIPREDMEKFADLINYLADSGIADEKDIVKFLDAVGASAKNFGLVAEDVAALGAAMVNLKIPAEVGARALDTLLGKLAAPENLSPKAAEALEKIVGPLDKFADLIGKDAQGGLLQFLDRLEGLTGQQRISLLGALMGEGFDDEVARIVGGLDEIKRNLEAVKDTSKYEGSIAGLSEQRLELYNSMLKTMKNAIHELGVEFGEFVMPAAKGVVDTITEGLSDINAFNRGREKLREQGLDSEEERQKLIEAYKRENGSGIHDIIFGDNEQLANEDIRALGRGEIKDLRQNIDTHKGRRYQVATVGDFHDRMETVDGTGSANWRPTADFAWNPEYRRQVGVAAGGAPDPKLGFDMGADFEQRIQAGGKKAADELQEGSTQAGRDLGSTASAELQSAARSIGAQIGKAAAAEMRAAASEAAGKTRSAGSKVNADVGRSGGDVKAPNSGSGW